MSDPALRRLVAEVVRDVVREEVGGDPLVTGAAPVGPPRDELVQLRDDRDLDRFVRRLLALYENPKSRRDLRLGRIRFRLERMSGSAPSALTSLRIESGAVTEKQVKDAAESGRRIVLGRRAVLTPLGRERAKALDVPIEKER
jgi:hypothetical protein